MRPYLNKKTLYKIRNKKRYLSVNGSKANFQRILNYLKVLRNFKYSIVIWCIVVKYNKNHNYKSINVS